MKEKEWLEFKEKLKEIPLVTRINYLKEFLKKEKDKRIKSEIEDEIKKVEKIIKEQGFGNTKATVTTVMPSTGTIEEETEELETQPSTEQGKSLEETIESIPINGSEPKKPIYGADDLYKKPGADGSLYNKKEKIGKGIWEAITPGDWTRSEEEMFSDEHKEFSPAEEYISEVTTREGKSNRESFKSEDTLKKIRDYEEGKD